MRKAYKKNGSMTASPRYDSMVLDSDMDGVIDYQDEEPLLASPIIVEEHVAMAVGEEERRIYGVENARVEDKTVPKDSTKKYIQGIIAYTVPDTMVVGKNYVVKIRISKEENKQVLIIGDRQVAINDEDVHSTITIESIRVEPVMSANLTSNHDAFDIRPKSTEVQNIEDHGYTEWEWGITPLKSGMNSLKLVVKVRIINEHGSSFKDIVVFDRKIKTKANVGYTTQTFFEKYWQWFMTTIIIPIFLWWRKRKKKKEEPGEGVEE